MIPDQTINYKNTGFLDNDLLVTYLSKKNPLQLPKSKRIVVKGKTSNVAIINNGAVMSSSALSWVQIPNSVLNYSIFMLLMLSIQKEKLYKPI